MEFCEDNTHKNIGKMSFFIACARPEMKIGWLEKILNKMNE